MNSVTRYDKNYRAIQDIKEHQLGGTTRITVLYDFVGNVMKEQVYSSNASLTVQRRYVYDHAGRLSALYHQTNAQPEVLLGSYKYNELGQLMDKSIHSTNGTTFLQSIDYRYNIKGWLTNINNTGFNQGWSNDDTNDKFGMEIQYYVSSPANVGSTGDQLQQKSLYDGNISAVKWKINNNQDPSEERIYVFDYDVLNRIKKSHYARNTQSWSSPSWTGDSGLFDEVVAGYDKNGNFKITDQYDNPDVALTRFGKIQSSKSILDQLKFGYRLNGKHSNRLIDVDDTGNGSLGFTPASASITEEFQYHNNGNTKFDHNKGISNVVYNHLNLVQEIEFTRPSSQIDKIEYTYDGFGNKLSRVVKKNGVQVWRTDYVGEMQYDNGSLSFFATKEGRVVKNNSTYDYEYFHKDHQNNIRMVYGSLKETKNYRATMEDPSADPTFAQKEQDSFKNLPAVRHQNTTYNNTPVSPEVTNPDRSAKLNSYTDGTITATPVGPATMLTVSNGDKVYMETYAKYTQSTGSNGVLATATLASALTTPFGIVNSGETAALYQSINSNLGTVSAARGSSTTIPRAYIVWIFFNSSYQFVNAGGQSITAAAYNSFEKLSVSFTANQIGYLYVYVANESNINPNAFVYFDETYVVHEKNNLTLQVLQASDYYPFGLPFNQFQSDRLKEVSTGNYVPELRNRYMLQSQELQKDLDLTQYQFQWRMYDPILGRWPALDPKAMELSGWSPYAFSLNSPLRLIDPDGQKPTPAEAARMALHVYGEHGDDILIGGWRVSSTNYGINYDDDTGLKSRVYERVIDGKTEYTYATAGTEASMKDVGADVKQPLGESDQYHSSANNAKLLSRVLGEKELTFTGHSLGGGEAALNALVTNRAAITFNAASVSRITRFREGTVWTPFRSEGKIDAYIMITDPLNAFQKTLGWGADGNVNYVLPPNMRSVINGHSMENFLKYFNYALQDKDWSMFPQKQFYGEGYQR